MSEFSAPARAMIEAAWPQGRVYAADKVPDKAITPYVVMYSDDGRDTTTMLDGTAGTDGNRLMPMAVGATEDELNRATAAIKRGLRGQWVTTSGYTPALMSLESSGGVVRDPDGGALLSKTLFFTFSATETE